MNHGPSGRILLAGLFFTGVVGFPLVARGQDDSLRARGERLASTGRCGEALPVLAQAGAAAPDDGRIPLVTGQCLIRLQRYPEAVVALERAKGLDAALRDVDLSLGIARFHAGDAPGAERALADARAAGSARPELEFYEGMTRLQLGQFDAAAAESLERAGQAKPETLEPVASYYAGLAFRSVEERDRARSALRRVVDGHPGTPWADAAERALREMDESGSTLWARIQVGMEYDDNVIFRGAGVAVPSEIGGQSDPRGVWSVELGSELYRSEDWTVGARVNYYGSVHSELEDFDLQYPGGSLWVDRRIDEATLARVEYGFGYAWLGYDPYVASQVLTPQMFHSFGEWGVTRFWTQFLWSNFFPNDFDVVDGDGVGTPCPPEAFGTCGPAGLSEASERNRDGILYTAGVQHTWPIPIARTELLTGILVEYNDPRGSEYTYAGYGAELGATTRLPLDLTLTTRALYVYRPFANASTFPDPNDPNLAAGLQYGLSSDRRSDDFLEVDVILERKITDNLSASLRYDYLDNHSEVPVFDYNRHLFGGYLTLLWRN